MMQTAPKKELSLFDSTCIIVGIIIGAGIYKLAPNIATGAGSWWGVLAIWAIGGLLSLFGALGYAELATAYPKEGGDYVYLSRAYGPWTGYLFGWGQLAIIRPGDIAIMAFAFATYAREIFDPLKTYPAYSERIYAAAAVIVLTAINILGVKEGKWTQNILTTVKALGLLAIFAVALFVKPVAPAVTESAGKFPLSLALVFVLFCYGGWNEMAYVAAEVKNHRKNIVRALVLGATAVTVLYLLVNGAFLYILGFVGLANSQAVASDAVSTVFPNIGGGLISALVCISALGAVSGLIFTGARISYALGAEHKAFRLLGKWNERTGTPIWALVVQALIAIGLIAALGSIIDTIVYTAAPVYTFYLATSLAVIVLRRKEPNIERPYRVTGYPFTTIIFCAICAFLIYSTVTFAWNTQPKSLCVLEGVLLIGMAIYCITEVRTSNSHTTKNAQNK
ncbi:MAG: amino acid permease [Sedimentisphaerales bacterium]|nr:amino acid permease [Sedimentisphaerales bacterium]